MTPSAASDPERSPIRLELAYGAALGVVAAAVAALPGALRVAAHGQSVLFGWLALLGAGALLAGPLVALGRLSRALSRGWFVIGLALALATPVLMVFGSMLKSGTHHRPLGAATYAFVSSFVLAGSLALAARLLAVQRAAAPAKRRAFGLVLAACAAVLVLACALLARPLAREHVLGATLDGVLLAVLATGAVFLRARRTNAGLGLGVWVVVSVLGLVLLALLPDLRAAAVAAAPVLTTFAAWLVG